MAVDKEIWNKVKVKPLSMNNLDNLLISTPQMANVCIFLILLYFNKTQFFYFLFIIIKFLTLLYFKNLLF